MNVLGIAGPNSKYHAPGARLAGLWHGLVSPITFVVSLFNPNVRIYETYNRGCLYDLGFIIGISATLGGGSHETTKGFS